MYRRHPSRNRRTDPRQAIGRTALPVAPLGASLTAQACALTAAFSRHAAATTSASPEVLAALKHSPTARTLEPTAVHTTSDSVMNLQNGLNGRSTRPSGANSALTRDSGQDAGGVTTLSSGSASDSSQPVGLTFSESSLYVGTNSDQSSGRNGEDGALHASATADSTYTVPTLQLRGGFRYLTVCLDTSGRLDRNNVSLNFTSPPGKANRGVTKSCHLTT